MGGLSNRRIYSSRKLTSSGLLQPGVVFSSSGRDRWLVRNIESSKRAVRHVCMNKHIK